MIDRFLLVHAHDAVLCFAGAFSTETVQGWRQHLDTIRAQHCLPGECAQPTNRMSEPSPLTANQTRSVSQASPNPDSKKNQDFAVTESKKRKVSGSVVLPLESNIKVEDSVLKGTE